MARSIDTIQDQMVTQLVALLADTGNAIDPATWSQYDYRQLLTRVEATGVATMEQLMDSLKAEVETLVANAAPQTLAWWQAMMFKFQYSETDPQIIQLDTDPASASYLAYKYPVVNTLLQIIKYCSVTSGSLGTVNIKCAAQSAGLPVALTSDQIDAAQSYCVQLNNTGIYISVVSTDADLIYIEANIYYKGQYSAIIQSTVIAAINNYLASIPFNGRLLLTDLEIAIKTVPGVNDVQLTNVSARQYDVAYADGTPLVQSNTELQRFWNTVAGYIITETDSGHTITDSLTFIAE